MPRRCPNPVFALAALALVMGLAGQAPAAVTTTFDVGLEGWTVTGDNASTWNNTGGNPGGCLAVNDLATGADNFCVAPVAFHGDWSGLGPADTLALDYFFHYLNGTIAPPLYTFRIAGPGGSARAIGGASTVPPADVWTHYAVTLDPAQWVIESGTWQGILTSVNSLLVAGEFVTGQEQVLIDNVRLSGTILPVVVSCVVADFSAPGTEEWSFSGTASATNPGSGGNGGGFCSIGDGAANSYAYAPSRFLGNWSSLDGSGRLSIDLRVLARSGVDEGAPELIRISGPGGEAHVSLAPGGLPAAARVWKRLTFPLAAGSWTLVSGTWAGLLANVTQCRIDLEYFGSTETVGFDNFARLAAGCPDPDLPLSFSGGLSLCDFHSLVGARNAALDPADGQLYGVVNLTAGSGGGLYAISGPNAGTLLQAYPNPAHLLFEPDGDAYVSEDFAGVVDRLAAGGGTGVWVSGFHTGDEDLAGMCVAGPGFDGSNVDPGDVLVTDYGFTGAPDEIWAFSVAAAENERLLMPDPGNIEFYDLAAAPDLVWACDFLDPNHLSRISPEGARTLLQLLNPVPGMVSIVYDEGARRIYVAGQAQGSVCMVDPASGMVTTVATGFDSLDICSLEIDAAGRHLYVTDVAYGRVYEICLPAATAVREEIHPNAWLEAAPNPLISGTRLRFELAHDSRARMVVHDLLGRRVRQVMEGPLGAGLHALAWDGRDDTGRRVPPGIYLAVLEAEGARRIARLVVLR